MLEEIKNINSEKSDLFFWPAREEAFRGARTLETGSIDSTDRVDAI